MNNSVSKLDTIKSLNVSESKTNGLYEAMTNMKTAVAKKGKKGVKTGGKKIAP